MHTEIMTGKRKSFSLNEKRSLLEAYDKLPKTSQRDAAAKLGVPQATLCSLLKQRETVMAASDGHRKRMRTGKAPVVEAALVKWIDNARSRNAPLSGRLLRETAEELAASLGEDNFRVSIGWLERFKKRENIVFRKLHGEAAEADTVSRDEWLEDQWGQMRQEYSYDSTAARPSVCSSDSNSSSRTRLPSKRRLSFNDNQEDGPSKYTPDSWKKRISDNSSNSEENELNSEMAIFAPLESDLDESANSIPESQLIRKDTEGPTGSTSGNQPEEENRNGSKDDDETITHSDAESESLLLPVEICMESQSQSLTVSTAGPCEKEEEVAKRDSEGSSPEQSPVHCPGQHTAGPPPSPDHSKPRSVTGSPPCTSSAISPASSETIFVSLISSSPSPAAPPSEPEPSIDSTSFWKSCNAAGCTQAIFTDFIKEMNDVSSRIQSDQASQEDHDFALTVMVTSGKLAELVTKQQEEIQRKQVELQKAADAMKDVVSALRK